MREHHTASELFLALAPDVSVPEELSDLDARHLEMNAVYKTLHGAASMFPQFARVPGPEQQPLVEEPSAAQVEQVDPLAEDFGQVGSAFSGAECLDNTPGCGRELFNFNAGDKGGQCAWGNWD